MSCITLAKKRHLLYTEANTVFATGGSALDSLYFSFHLTIGDFRRSLYYGFFIRNRKFLRITVYVLGTFLFYALLCAVGVFSINALVLFIAAAYFSCLLLMLASLERQVLQQAKSPDSFLKETYEITFSGSDICIEIPSRKIKTHIKPSKFYCAFEISKLFLLYQTQEQVFLVPKSIMTDADIQLIRSILSTALGKRFYSHALAKSQE